MPCLLTICISEKKFMPVGMGYGRPDVISGVRLCHVCDTRFTLVYIGTAQCLWTGYLLECLHVRYESKGTNKLSKKYSSSEFFHHLILLVVWLCSWVLAMTQLQTQQNLTGRLLWSIARRPCVAHQHNTCSFVQQNSSLTENTLCRVSMFQSRT